MQTITLQAHFDGKQILLDEPYELEPGTKLIITVLSKDRVCDERRIWLELSRNGLENAYGEVEPEYTFDLIRGKNPDYERR